MNSPSAAMNAMAPNERPGFAAERLVAASDSDPPATRSTLLLRRAAVGLILLFYTTQFSTMTLSRFMRVPDESLDVLPPRLIVTACGVLFSLLILKVQRSIGRARLRKRVLVAAGLAVAGSFFHAAANLAVFGAFVGFGHSPFLEYLLSYCLSALDWLWFYSAISVMLLALTYAADLAESDDRIVALQNQAHAAQLKALRYQLNPHFLFNTLNSIAALVGKNQSADAEAMVVSLSDFLRSTLAMEPGKEIPLGDEIELQSLYLDIEKARFPNRLKVAIDTPDDILSALVPNLITQPLVENAIKYGVACSSEPVSLEVTARAEGGHLLIEVRDDGGNATEGPLKGTQVGLRNVSERLWLHYGADASLTARKLKTGGFLAQIRIPFRTAA